MVRPKDKIVPHSMISNLSKYNYHPFLSAHWYICINTQRGLLDRGGYCFISVEQSHLGVDST